MGGNRSHCYGGSKPMARATELGLGGYWSTPAYVDQIGDFISMEEGETCLGLFYLGTFEGSMPTREPGDWREKVQWYD